MGELDLIHRLWDRFQARDWAGARALLHDDATMHWVTSGEHFDDADAIIRVQAIYPEGWAIQVNAVDALGPGAVHSVVEVRHGTQRFFANSRFAVDGGRIRRITEYWGTFEPPPDWRNATAPTAVTRRRPLAPTAVTRRRLHERAGPLPSANPAVRSTEGRPVSAVTSTATLDLRRPSPHVAEVWLNRPDVRNAFNDQVIAELTAAFTALAADASLRVVVLAGHGKAFCAGADLHWMRAMADYSWEQNQVDAQALADMLWAIYRCPVPVVGRLQGDCYAGGVGLAAVCDVLVASDNVGFCLSEARLGLLPATIGPYVLKALGERACQRYFSTAERFSAAEAQRLGLVHELCSADQLDERVQAVVAALVANGPAAVRACKRLVQDLAGRPIDAALREDTARRIADIRSSAEGKEGVSSFLNKRPPAWL